MISVPGLVAASSIPRLVQDSAHHLYCSWSALTPKRDVEVDVNVKITIAALWSIPRGRIWASLRLARAGPHSRPGLWCDSERHPCLAGYTSHMAGGLPCC